MGTSGCGFARGGRGFTCGSISMGYCTGWLLSLECVVIPNKPHQPLSFKRSFGHGKEFSAKLVCKMAFLHYDDSKDAVFCHTCLKLKRMKTSMRADPAFVSSLAS